MIQQICLSKAKAQYSVDFSQPLELVINAKDYSQFEKTISILFDMASIERIKKAKELFLSS